MSAFPRSTRKPPSPGLTADLTLSEFPGRPFAGKLVRTANAIDPTSRTLLVEIAVDNPTGQLFTGSYAEVHLKLPTAASAFILPVNTLLFRAEGLRVATVGDDQKVDLDRSRSAMISAAKSKLFPALTEMRMSL